MKKNKPTFKKMGLLFVTALPFAGSAVFAISAMNYNVKNDSKNISVLENTLQDILSEKKDFSWTKTELENKIAQKKLDIDGGISVQELGSKRTTAKNEREIITTWKFIGNAKITNPYTYNGEIIIEHYHTEPKISVQSIIKIQKDLQKVLNSSLDEWNKQNLEAAIVAANIDIIGGITVENAGTSFLRSSQIVWKTTSWTFIGNGVKYSGKTTLSHKWISKTDASIEIDTIKDKLEDVVNNRKKTQWTVDELKTAIFSAGIDVKDGFDIEDITPKSEQNRLGEGGPKTTIWKFTGKGSVNNNYKYKNSVTINHAWSDLHDVSQHIFHAKAQIIEILNSRTNNAWNETDLLEALTSSENAIDIKGGLTVTKLENPKTRSWQGSDHIDSWKFTGHGKADNDYKYKGELTLKHEWSDKLDTTRELSEIQPTIENIVSERKDSSWTQYELQKVIDDSGLDPIKGAIIVSKQETFNERLYENISDSETWVFTARGNKNNNFKFNNSITVVHNWSTTKDKTKSILEKSLDLQTILNLRTNSSWSKEELEQEIVKAGIDSQGGIEVKQININLNTRSWGGGWEKASWEFSGKGDISNDWKYNGSVTLNHEWDNSYDTTVDIDNVESLLQGILDSRPRSAWTKEELETELVSKGIDEQNGILVKQVIPNIENRSSVGAEIEDTWEFIGNGNELNQYLFNGKIQLKHKWSNKMDTTVDIAAAINDLQIVLNSEEYNKKTWDKPTLEQAIVDAKIDLVGGITVEEIDTVKTIRSSTGGPHISTWKFTGHGKESNNWKYKGSTILEHKWNNKIDTTKPISVIQDELKAMVNSAEHKNKPWIQEELQMAVNKKWVGAGITVSQKSTPTTRSFVETPKTTTWIFTGNGNINNDLPYNESIEIVHNWIQITPTTKHIESIKTELETIINKRKDKTWTKVELQSEIDNVYGLGEITIIDSSEIIKGRSSGTASLSKNWTFKGNGTDANQLKYFGETLAIHSWIEKIDTSIDISTINDKLNILVNDEAHKEKAWTLADLQKAVNTRYGVGEIEVKAKTRNTRLAEKKEYKNTYIFIGKGNIENNYKYKGSTEVVHIWNQRVKDISINWPKDQQVWNILNAILNSKPSSYKWTANAFQKEIDAKFPPMSGLKAIWVLRLPDYKEYIHIEGIATIDNDFIYYGAAQIWRTWM
ncbi:hypothetical protein ESOMN_v1c02790 [Williamsoniiplasma somnilux]|uniref:Uncharacterized protein n=3 Tax=Williamsoniiplasma somnilux TaxID=215578 RepID=A0A2K8P0X9_9MOLU|nr:hypothetical protein [Williamsoniiplasma somnilux]ATZ18661.1 hypothetical protein ESOMN_v1c02790 [Williamsoniiplasma somnilux]